MEKEKIFALIDRVSNSIVFHYRYTIRYLAQNMDSPKAIWESVLLQ